MAHRVIVCVVVALIAFWINGLSKQVVNDTINDEEPPATSATAVGACNAKIATSNDILAYTKNCLEFSNEAMECVAKFIQKREKDPFPIALECTPNLPEPVKKTLRKILESMNNRTEVESRCRMNDSEECATELLVIEEKHDEMMKKFIDLWRELTGPAKEAVDKFNLFVTRVASSTFG